MKIRDKVRLDVLIAIAAVVICTIIIIVKLFPKTAKDYYVELKQFNGEPSTFITRGFKIERGGLFQEAMLHFAEDLKKKYPKMAKRITKKAKISKYKHIIVFNVVDDLNVSMSVTYEDKKGKRKKAPVKMQFSARFDSIENILLLPKKEYDILVKRSLKFNDLLQMTNKGGAYVN